MRHLTFRAIVTTVVTFFFSLSAMSQIGYQVALLNSATGEPRANETVSCEIVIEDSQDNTIFQETQKATTNGFGVLSLTIGNADMFKNVDWSKLPFFVSVSVDKQLVGRTQILNVPIAEYAKTTGTLTYENISSIPVEATRGENNSEGQIYEKILFSSDGTCVYKYYFPYSGGAIVEEGMGRYYIDGNTIGGYFEVPGQEQNLTFIGHYFPEQNVIVVTFTYYYN